MSYKTSPETAPDAGHTAIKGDKYANPIRGGNVGGRLNFNVIHEGDTDNRIEAIISRLEAQLESWTEGGPEKQRWSIIADITKARKEIDTLNRKYNELRKLSERIDNFESDDGSSTMAASNISDNAQGGKESKGRSPWAWMKEGLSVIRL